MPEVLNIPILEGGGPFRENIELDNEEFILSFSYNQRDPAWYMTMLKNGEIIALRLKLISGYNLLQHVLSLEKPTGFLYLYDAELKTSLGRDPDIDSLGKSILLVYEPLES